LANDTLIIVNPRSRGGKTAKVWGGLYPTVEGALGACDVVETRVPADAIQIAREAYAQGRKLVVAAGGDGTVHEVANGLLEGARDANHGKVMPVLGIIGMGTGGDFTKTLGIEHKFEEYVETLRTGVDKKVDAGRAQFIDHDGKPASRYFINILSMGVSGLADRLVAKASRALGSNFAYMQSSLRALMASRVGDCVCEIEDETGTKEVRLKTHLIAVCNGRYFGAGMMVGPMAECDDGLFEVVSILEPSRFKLALRMQSLYTGAHMKSKDVVHMRCRKISISLDNHDYASDRFILDVDGEPLGRLPLQIEAMPKALTLRVPRAAAVPASAPSKAVAG